MNFMSSMADILVGKLLPEELHLEDDKMKQILKQGSSEGAVDNTPLISTKQIVIDSIT